MKGKKWLILLASLAVVLLASSIGVTGSSFIDQENSIGNTFQAWTSNLWRQTTQEEFNTGILSQVDTASSPDNVKLAQVGWGSYSSELLTNPGAEAGDTIGWTAEGSNTGSFAAGFNSPGGSAGPHSGSYCFFWNQPSASDDWAYQEVDLSSYLGEIQAGEAQIRAGGWLVCSEYHVPVWDIVRLKVVLYDSGHAEISTIYDTDELNIPNWTEYLVEDYDLPTNTQYVRLYFQTYEPAWDSVNADDLTVKVRVKSGWYNASWQYRRAITFTSDSAKIPSTLSNFPVLISLGSDSNLAADAQDDGDDILFTSSNGTTNLDHEIEKFDGSTGGLVAWVEVPSLSTGTVIYMYYGNSGASSQQNAAGTWDGNFKAVWHLNETSGTHYDATANNNDGTPYGGLNQNATGKVNGADVFDGTDDAVVALDAASLDITSAVTIEAWIYSAEFKNQYPGIVTKWDWSGTNPQRSYSLYLMDWTKPCIMISANGTYLDQLVSTIQLLPNTWYYLVGVSTGTKWILYINGAWDSEKAIVTTIHSGTAKLSIGSSMQDGSISANETFKGTIDEARVSDTVRSAAWIGTAYNNQNSPNTFYSVGSEDGLYVSSGTIASQVFDTGVAGIRWDALFWDETLESNTDITFEVRAANTLNGGFPDASWIDVGGTSPVTSGLPSGQYMQWRATLTTSDTSKTPTLHEVRVYYY